MNVLITGAASPLGQALAGRLASQHRLRLMDRVAVPTPEKAEAFVGDLLDPASVWQAVRGMHAVIHTAAPPPDLPGPGLARDQALLELATRGTHVLASAMVEAGIRRLVYAGTLAIFRAYADDVYITENWKPLPGTDMEVMSNYLGELGCREFAMAHRLTATAVRLGTLVLEEDVLGQPPDLAWLDLRDAAQAFEGPLAIDNSDEVSWVRRWSVIHACADLAHPKYLIDVARRHGFRPEHNFQAHWQAA